MIFGVSADKTTMRMISSLARQIIAFTPCTCHLVSHACAIFILASADSVGNASVRLCNDPFRILEMFESECRYNKKNHDFEQWCINMYITSILICVIFIKYMYIYVRVLFHIYRLSTNCIMIYDKVRKMQNNNKTVIKLFSIYINIL